MKTPWLGAVLTAADGTRYLVTGKQPSLMNHGDHFALVQIPDGMHPIDFGRRFTRHGPVPAGMTAEDFDRLIPIADEATH